MIDSSTFELDAFAHSSRPVVYTTQDREKREKMRKDQHMFEHMLFGCKRGGGEEVGLSGYRMGKCWA
jgi:hypothetical protein